MRTEKHCRIISYGKDGRCLIPECWGTVDKGHTGLSDREIITAFCYCDRRPKYKRGERKRVERLEWRIRRLQREVDGIESAAMSRARGERA